MNNDAANSGLTYKYYILGDRVPIRVVFNENGLEIGAETPDRDSGQLIIKNTLLSRIAISPEVEEISRDAFDRLCEQFIKKNGSDCTITHS